MQQLSHPSDFIDGESDIYYYNFNGKSGKFFVDNNNNVCLVKHDDIKIDIKTFRITDDSGIIYIFGKPGTISEGKLYTTSWYLTKIISPSGGEINFEYNNVASNKATRRVHSVCYIDASYNTGSHEVSEPVYHAGQLYLSTVNEPLLSRITTKSGYYIDLSAMTQNRMDIYNSIGKALKKISLYNAQNELQKGIEFNYGYFEANTNRRYRDSSNKEVSSYNYLNYRLRLESIKEFSKLSEYASTYRFEYYGDNNPATDDIYTLPYRLSPCQDHWGYYNGSYNKVIFPGNSNNSYPYIQVDAWFESLISNEYIYLNSHVIYGANREPDAEAGKAGTLNKIIYPTGGYTKFDFEVHRDQLGSLKGGLRVKQIEVCDNNGNISKKKYNYSGYSGYSGYADANRAYHTYLYNPFLYRPATFGYESLTHIFGVTRNTLSIMGVPSELVYGKNYNLMDETGRPLNINPYLKVIRINGTSPLRLGIEGETSYSEVAEEIEGLGKTEYHYTNCSNQYEGTDIVDNNQVVVRDAFVMGWVQTLKDYWNEKYYSNMDGTSFAFPYSSAIDYGWKNRLLNCKRMFDKDGKLVSEDSIFYMTKLLHAVPNFKVFQLSEYNYMYTRSYNIGGMVNVTKEVSRQYTSDGKVIRTSKEYDYLSSHHKKATEIRTILSEGGSVTEKYYYPTEYDNYFQTLTGKNILAPVDVRSYRNGKLISGIQIQYDDNGLPLTRYKAESTGADIIFNKSNPFTFTPYLWNSYNTANLLTSQKVKDNTVSIYLWSYSGQYPIAEIKNATYVNVAGVIGQTLIDRVASASIPSEADMAAINALRTNTTTLKDMQITTYTYKPLVGMLTATDPSGVTTYYEYDDCGRLKETYIYKDNIIAPANKQILQKYEYHYQNQ